MKGSDRLNFRLKWVVKGCQQALLSTILLLVGATAQAQITPDGTLGGERSQVVPRALGGASIEGGAIRGSNLFHSFSEFNVGNQQSVYFTNPTGIQNILTRVTGNTVSNINGTLGIDGAANLFLLNPNGIIFGQNARLDVRGSFVGSTANAIGFGTQGDFNTTNPQTPSLLTVNPSALLFTQINSGSIINRSRVDGTTTSPSRYNSAYLVGGNITFEGGQAGSLGGRLELGGLAGVGAVGFVGNGNEMRLSFPEGVPRADVTLQDQAALVTQGKDISIYARNLRISGLSVISTVLPGGNSNLQSQAGDIIVDTTNSVSLEGKGFINSFIPKDAKGNTGNIVIRTGSLNLVDSAILNSNDGQGNSGIINIRASDRVTVTNTPTGNLGSAIFTGGNGGQGNAGDIQIDAKSIQLSNGGYISTLSTNGRIGNSGNIRLNASDSIIIDGVKDFVNAQGETSFVPSKIGSELGFGSVGQGGTIYLTTGLLALKNGGGIDATSFGRGNSGNILITAREGVSIDGGAKLPGSGVTLSGIFAKVIGRSEGEGNGGEIRISTPTLRVINGGQVSATLNAKGNAGNIDIDAPDGIIIAGSFSEPALFEGKELFLTSAINAQTLPGTIGNGGTIRLTTNSLSLSKGGYIAADIGGQGNGGSIFANVRDRIIIDGINPNGSSSGLFTRSGSVAIGDAGNVELKTTHLSILNGGEINSGAIGQGRAGRVLINAETVQLDGAVRSPDGLLTTSQISNAVDRAGGIGGEIRISTGSLALSNGASIDAYSFGGNSGDITIDARNNITIDGVSRETYFFNGSETRFRSSINNQVHRNSTNNGGSIQIKTGTLSVTNGGSISANTFAGGNAGNIIIDTRDRIIVDGSFGLGLGSEIVSDTGDGLSPSDSTGMIRGRGKGGEVVLNTSDLTVSNGGIISASTINEGNAGSIKITARNSVNVQGFDQNERVSIIQSTASDNSTGRSGDIQITTPSLNLIDFGRITVSHFGIGNAGSININANKIKLADIGEITSRTAFGNGGNLNLTAKDLFLMRRNSYVSTTAVNLSQTNPGNGGNITINAGFLVSGLSENNDIAAGASRGRGGNITVTAQGIYGFISQSQADLERLFNTLDLLSQTDLGISPENQIFSISRTDPTLSGQIRFNTPNVDPTKGTADLSTTTIDTSNQMGQVCPRNSNIAKMGKFVVSGPGSLPPNPIEPLTGSTAIPLATIDGSPTTTIATTPSFEPSEIVEAQDWIRENGKVKLVAAAPPSSHSTPTVCPTPQLH